MILDLLGEIPDASSSTAAEKEDAAKSLADKCGYAAAALTIIPIPGTEIVAVAPLHVTMVMRIAQIYGADITRDSASELVLRIGATAGLSLLGSTIASTAAKVLLPFAGGILISAPFMYASTIAIGTVARIHFERGGELTDEEMKAVYKESVKRARQVFDPKKARDSNAKDLAQAAVSEAPESAPAPAAAAPEEDPVARLERLKALLDKGLIEPEEYDTVKKRILDGI